ncbi:E7 [Human papillomavirus 80]|uniref:Protein E7 n=2 Tax=Papillomaviridae TaxID=151340 RepID=O56953_9PAPI|nr:E7 [Human papillomavirus]CAA75471.1 E7 [Human papillomavirus 80]
MIGKEATIPDIELELQELVQPTDLHCYEELSEEETEEEPQHIPYKIVAPCCFCESKLRLIVVATSFGIRAQEELLFGEVKLVCPGCREKLRHV